MAGKASGAVVVTGASTGIGRATALFLDKKGYTVFAGVRKEQDAKSLSDAGSERLTPITVDVTKERSIASARDKVREAVGEQGVVGLVNNAGVGNGGPVETLDLQDLRDVLEVNLVGQVAVTQAFLPLVAGREGHDRLHRLDRGTHRQPVHVAIQHLQVRGRGPGRVAAIRARAMGIDVVVVEPGSINTPIWSKGAETIDEQTDKMSDDAKRLYGKQLERMERVLFETASRGISPEKVADVIHKAIASDKPKHRYLVGTDAKIAARLKGNLPDRAFAGVIGRRFKMPTDVPAE